jgi:hypothetical protein
VQLKTSSAKSAASANVPVLARSPALSAHATAFSFDASREPMRTSWPSCASFVAIVFPTIPVPRTPMRISRASPRDTASAAGV